MTQVLIGDQVVEVEPTGQVKDGQPVYRIPDEELPRVRRAEVAEKAREAAMAATRGYGLEESEARRLASDGLLDARDQVERGFRI